MDSLKRLWLLLLLPVAAQAEVFEYAEDKEPEIICQVLRLCDLALQKQEKVTSVMIGDSVRWNINQFKTGGQESWVQHLTIKPLAPNLSTSLVIGTNRRAYHLILRSSTSRNMSKVSFTYSDSLTDLMEDSAKVKAPGREQTGRTALHLDTAYSVEGDAELLPEQIYNDGVHTFIRMPLHIRQGKLPALLAVGKEGGMFTKERQENLNYRTRGTTYIIDTIPGHLILLLDSGDEEKRVDIYHTQKTY